MPLARSILEAKCARLFRYLSPSDFTCLKTTTLELRSRTKELSKSPQILGEATQASTTILLFMLPFTLLVVLTSSKCGDQHFLVIVCCKDHHHIRIGDERTRLLAAWPVISKN
jgi:hypothetical protein